MEKRKISHPKAAEIKRKKQAEAVAKANAKRKYDKIYNSCILDIGRTKADIWNIAPVLRKVYKKHLIAGLGDGWP